MNGNKLVKSIRMSEKKALAMAAALLVLLSGSLVYVSADSNSQLLNVQIYVSTSQPEVNYFYLTAYNSTGNVVAQSQSQYPGFGMELPQGTYLFAVTAIQRGNTICGVVCPVQSTVMMPPIRNQFVEEYGYLLTQITGPATLNIHTENIYNITSTKVAVHVNFKNGTGAADAQVYASVVGAQYFYPYGEYNMYVRTNATGDAILKVPSLPVEIYAWDWVQVNLPKNITTVQTTIGGEPVNVTVYWQPTYVGLAGTALVIPPTNTTTITLQVQRQDFWAVPLAAQTSATGQAIVSGGFSSSTQEVPASLASQLSSVSGTQYTQPSESAGTIPQLPSPSTQSGAPTGFSGLILPNSVAVAAAVAAVLILSLFFILRRR